MENLYPSGSNYYIFNEELLDIPKLDLFFVCRGTKKGPFSVLSPYHRYILYLYYGLGMNIRETAKTLDRSINTIWTELHWIQKKIRFHWD